MNQEYVITDDLVNTYFDIVTTVDGSPLSLVVPKDAGRHTFSLMAAALKQLENNLYDLVVLVTPSPSDQFFFQASGKLITPLGAMEVDSMSAKELGNAFPELTPVELDRNQQSTLVADSFPVLASFLKQISPFTKVLPILLPTNALDTATAFGKAVSEIKKDQHVVVIAQTELDRPLLAALEYNQPEIFTHAAGLVKRQRGAKSNLPEISAAPAAAALQYACSCSGNTVSVLQEHARHDHNPAAVMMWDYQPPQLSTEQKNELLQLARQAIETYIGDGVIPDLQSNDPALNRKTGVFITLRINGMLRGCIGHMAAERPLAQAVQEMAIAAATSDPRFPPLTRDELQQITTKIAILSPLKRISAEDVEIGKHGLLVSHAGRRGVLLPEVASERGWDRETFLENLCRKAGLPRDTWRQNPTLYGFTTIVFGNE